jgi:hypothetical protein
MAYEQTGILRLDEVVAVRIARELEPVAALLHCLVQDLHGALVELAQPIPYCSVLLRVTEDAITPAASIPNTAALTNLAHGDLHLTTTVVRRGKDIRGPTSPV